MNYRVPIFLCALALVLPACMSTSPVAVPDTLKPGANETLAMIVPAKGVQIYECRVAKDAAGQEWAFVAPEAKLFDARGEMIGRHGAGPYWEASDGSRVTATLKARTDAPTAGAIPWLLLAAKDRSPAGSFSKVTSIQRVNTVGGLAPPTPCTQQMIGQQARVSYAADYRFYTAN